MASHLEVDTSLVTATHVCHSWRTTLLSSPYLWSHLDFTNIERALAYLERSKSGPLTVNLVDADDPPEIATKSLNEIAARVTTLRADHGFFLSDLLAYPMPKLEALDIIGYEEFLPKAHLPSLTSLVLSDFYTLQFHTPTLTSLHLTSNPDMEWDASVLLGFLRNCPLLEVASFSGGVDPSSDEVVSLPLLRSFTHESPRDEYQLCLLDQLSLPSTCRVVLKIDVTDYGSDPWIPGLPTPRDSSRLLDIRTVKIAAYPCGAGTRGDSNVTLKIELVTSAHGSISFDRITYSPEHTYDFTHKGFLKILESVEIDSVETLCFDHYPVPNDCYSDPDDHYSDPDDRYSDPDDSDSDPGDDGPWDATSFIAKVLRKTGNLKTLILGECHITNSLHDLPPCPTVDTLVVSSWPLVEAFYSDVLMRLQEFAESRKKAGFPLKVLTLVSPVAKPHPMDLKMLTWRGSVGRVEVVRGDDALNWDVDKYVLAATQEDNANRF